MKQALLAIIVLLGAAFGGYRLLSKHPNALPSMPDLDRRTSEARPSAEFLKAQAQVRAYRAKIQEKPEVLQNYVTLAEVYLQESRVTAAHHRYVPIAEAIVNAALARDPNYFEAMVTKSGILMTRHNFSEAQQLITKAVSINPYNSGAYGILCDASVELGEYSKAVEAVDQMMQRRPDLRSYARASYLREIHGDIPGAEQAMMLAADAGLYGSENREWALYNLGHLYYNEGKLDTADFIFKGILEERPGYGFALSGRAMVETSRHQYAQAIADLVQAMQVMPEHMFVEQLSDIYLAMGDTAMAHQMEAKVFEAYKLHEADGWNVNREYAAYSVNHDVNPGESLERAAKEYNVRPHNADAIDTYAWALYRNGRNQDARTAIEPALALNPRNGLVAAHAGLIDVALGRTADARRELSNAFASNPNLTPTLKPIAAKALLQLGGMASLAQ